MIPTVELATDTHGSWYWQATLPEGMDVPSEGDVLTVRLADERIFPYDENRIRKAIVARTSFPGSAPNKPHRMTAWHSRLGGIRFKVIPA